MGLEILGGRLGATGPHEFAPLPAYVMALVYRVAAPAPRWCRWFNVLLGTAACGLLYLAGREAGGRRVGLLSALIAAVYAPFIFYSTVPLKSAMAIFLFSLNAWLFVASVNRPDPARLLGLGLACGLMLNTRPHWVAVLPFLLLFLIFHYQRQGRPLKVSVLWPVLVVIGLLAAVSPFVALNWRSTGSLHLTTAQTGRNLYYGNNPHNPRPFTSRCPGPRPRARPNSVQFIIEASRRSDRHLTPREASDFWVQEVLRYAEAQPGQFAWKNGPKVWPCSTGSRPATIIIWPFSASSWDFTNCLCPPSG
jgi:4-amino-4-deoxy-L-arabinose transferase-like glycosyltransferase